MADPTPDEATTEKILRYALTLGFMKPTPAFKSTIVDPGPRISEADRVFDAGRAGGAAALDEGASAGLLTRLNAGGGGATFNAIDDGLIHPLSGKPPTPGATAEEKARFAAYLESLSPSEFLFQARRAGFFFTTPGVSPDFSFYGNVLIADEIARRVDAQQITRDGRLIQPIGPITTLPVAPPPREIPPGAGIGVAPGIIPAPSDGAGKPISQIGPGLGTIITVSDGIASGTAKAVDKRGNGQIPPGEYKPPRTGSGGTGRPPGLDQAFPDPLFERNPPDP